MERNADTPGVIAPPPLMLLASFILGFAISAAAPLGLLADLPVAARYGAGGALCAAAIALALSAVGRFGAAKTPVNPYYAPVSLVTTGVFSHLRNPMYVSFYVLSLGLAIAFASEALILTTVVLAIAIHYGVVRREEAFLERKFGEEYRQYKARIPRYGWRF
ncbi:MAG: isoprenylcysteine carboxylmethyltransferase family protein [Parvularculaceae bacterium]